MPSEEDYGSDYDAIPEAGRTKQLLDSDETDDELSSSAPRRAPPFFDNDGDDDDDDDTPVIVEETRQDRSAASSTSSLSSATANPIIRRPTAFPAPNLAITSSSTSAGGGPTFYGNGNNNNSSNKTPEHAPVSGTSMFCVEGYVNTPELSAGRGGGLSQGLPANGPYKSLFRASSESRGSNRLPVGAASVSSVASSSAAVGAGVGVAATAIAPDAGLHVLAEAAQSPESLSPISAASPTPAPPGHTHTPPTHTHFHAHAHAPTPAPTAKKRRKPSPLAPSPPASSIEPLQSIPAATQPSPPAAVSIYASPPHVVDYAPPRPSQVQAKPPRAGGTGRGKHKEKAPAPASTPAPAAAAVPRRSSAQAASVSGSDGRRYERHSLPHRQPGQPAFPTEHREVTDPAVPARPRNLQKNRAGLEQTEVSSVPPPPPPPAPAPANDGGYDYARGYYPSYYETDPLDASNAAVHTVHDGGQSLSPPPPQTWDSPRPSPSSAVNHYLTSARTTSKESSPTFTTDSRSQTQGSNHRMVTLFIEDRRHGTDELAEVHVPLRTIGEGCLWADARDVCAALQSGPSRIDGPAKLFAMRGKYRQIFLRISADGEETSQSANLRVQTDKTLSIVVEGISDPRAVTHTQFFGLDPSPHVNPGPTASLLNTAHLLTPVSTHLDLEGVRATPPSHKEEWSGGPRKRKRETSLGRKQQPPFGSPESRNPTNTIDASAAVRTPHGQYTRPWKSRRSELTASFDGGYASDSPPAAYRGQSAQKKDQIVPGSRVHVSGYETDQPTPSMRSRLSSVVMAAQEQHQSSERRVSSLLQPPPSPSPVEGSQRVHDEVVAFLQEKFMEDPSHWNEFTRDRSQVGSLSNAALLRIYWFAQDRLDTWVGSRLPKHLNSKKVEIRDVLDALVITEDWYQECNETLSLVVAYGERGQRGENARAVAACRDRAPKPHAGRVRPTDLLLLLRQVHEEYCEKVRGRNGQSRDSSIE